MEDLSAYPGGDLVSKGIADLKAGNRTEEALLVSISSTRLRRLGFDFPSLALASLSPEIALYSAIEARLPRGAYGTYNALIQRVVSFIQCYKPGKIADPPTPTPSPATGGQGEGA
jgi:hypothetical protein